MEFALYFTLTAVLAYLLADWILDRIEIAYGRRFKYRNYIFFFIILGLAYVLAYFISPESELPALQPQDSQGLAEKPDQ